MPACKVCTHEHTREINRALALGSGSDRDIATQFGVSQSSLNRHKRNHFRPYLAEIIREDPELVDFNLALEVKALYFRGRRFLNAAEDANDWPAVKAFHDTARADLETLAKIVGDIDESTKITCISPEVQTAIIAALEGHPEARRSVVGALKALEKKHDGS